MTAASFCPSFSIQAHALSTGDAHTYCAFPHPYPGITFIPLVLHSNAVNYTHAQNFSVDSHWDSKKTQTMEFVHRMQHDLAPSSPQIHLVLSFHCHPGFKTQHRLLPLMFSRDVSLFLTTQKFFWMQSIHSGYCLFLDYPSSTLWNSLICIQ